MRGLISKAGEMISSDGDGLAERAAQAEHRAADDAAAAERQHDRADHAPLVAPSASAASCSPGGVCENTWRITAHAIGITIIETAMPAQNALAL